VPDIDPAYEVANCEGVKLKAGWSGYRSDCSGCMGGVPFQNMPLGQSFNIQCASPADILTPAIWIPIWMIAPNYWKHYSGMTCRCAGSSPISTWAILSRTFYTEGNIFKNLSLEVCIADDSLHFATKSCQYSGEGWSISTPPRIN
jgi:hypothetical protein